MDKNPHLTGVLHPFRPQSANFALHVLVDLRASSKTKENTQLFFVSHTIPSMYDIFAYIWLIFMVNVGKYIVHGSYGYAKGGAKK